MKVNEVIQQRRPARVQPSVVTQQAKVAGVVGQIAVSDQQQPPTEMDKVMAMRQYAAVKKQTDRAYAERLRQLLATAETATR
jgi:hypothetical protein